MLLMVMLTSSAFVRLEYGVDLRGGKKESIAYKGVLIEESKMQAEGITQDDFYGMITSTIQNSKADVSQWDYVDTVKDDEKGIHYVGGRFQTTPSIQALDYYVWTAMHDTTDVVYKEKKGLFSRTVTIELKPIMPETLAGGVTFEVQRPDTAKYDYYFVMLTPGKITSTDGKVSLADKRVEWHINDYIQSNTGTYKMNVTYADYSNVKFIVIGAVILIGIGISVFLKNRNRVVVTDNEPVYMRPMEPVATPEHITYEQEPVNKPQVGLQSIKCPTCGATLSMKDDFCENCGTFL